jgi:hypothetical protein
MPLREPWRLQDRPQAKAYPGHSLRPREQGVAAQASHVERVPSVVLIDVEPIRFTKGDPR